MAVTTWLSLKSALEFSHTREVESCVAAECLCLGFGRVTELPFLWTFNPFFFVGLDT